MNTRHNVGVRSKKNTLADMEESKKHSSDLVNANRKLARQNIELEKRIDELRNENKDLKKINCELDRFVYSASHDLRSPLTSILGLLGFIEKDSKDPDTLLHASMIHSCITRLDLFISNILTYARNNRTPLEVQAIPLPETVQDEVNSLCGMKDAQGMGFKVDIETFHPFASDLQRFNAIMENLISNAIKYRDHKKQDSYVKISGIASEEELVLEIEDNGIGIEEDYNEKIFEMFYRIPGKAQGSGLGLYIVKEMVDIMQGSITCISKIGVGTTFHLRLKNLIV